jgi:hypothetical protein
VTGIDDKTTSTGYTVSGGNILANKFQMGPGAENIGEAHVAQTFWDVSGPGTYSVPFYVSRTAAYTDAVADNYRINNTFRVVEK